MRSNILPTKRSCKNADSNVFFSKKYLYLQRKITRKDNTGSIFSSSFYLFLYCTDYFYSREALSSSPDFGLKYAGAISNTVLHPVCPSKARR